MKLNLKYTDTNKVLLPTRDHKTLGAWWLFELRFSHQSRLYLDSEVAPKSPTVSYRKILSGKIKKDGKITEIVINYRNNSITNYAILIDGAWGSGKTYFFKNEVKEGIDKIIFKAKSEIEKAKEYHEVIKGLC